MMRLRLQRIWRFLALFISAEKIWRWPRRSEVLIFNASGQEILLEYLRPWTPEVLHVEGELVNIPVLLASLFKRGGIFDAYVDSYIGRVQPRLIVTIIDNDLRFYTISARRKNIKTLFIQNGVRVYFSEVFETLDRALAPSESLEVDYMAVFGARIGAEYARYIQGDVIPIGSIKSNRYPIRNTRKSRTIAFVSQYRNTDGIMMDEKFYTRQEFLEKADRLVLAFLAKYARKHGKELFVVPCSGSRKYVTLEGEKSYYCELLGQPFYFSEWRWPGSSYEAIDSAEVVVCVDSTLGYESVARGNKTAILSIRSHLIGLRGLTYGWPESYPDCGPFWTNLPDPDVFEGILDHLFAINDEQWRAELTDCGFASVMAYDAGNSILKSILEKELGPPPISGIKHHAAGGQAASSGIRDQPGNLS